MELVEDGEAGEVGRDRGVFDETDVACSTAISDSFRTESVSGGHGRVLGNMESQAALLSAEGACEKVQL